MNNTCIDCGKKITYGATRCKTCFHKFAKGENSPSWEGGKPKCDCGKQLSNYNTKKCNVCLPITKRAFKDNKIKVNCDYCNKVKLIYPNELELKYHFCNVICSGKWKSQNFKNKDNPNWIDGRSYEEYPSEFNAKLKQKIIQRDNEKCQGEGCTMTRNDHLLIYDSDIEVHHIHYNRKDCSETNLITTCKQCNLKANYDRSYWQEYYSNKVLQCLKS